MMKYIRLSLTLLAIIILLNAAGLAQTGKNLSSKSWTLTELDGSTIGTTGIFLDFDESKNLVTGNAGCNNLSGRIKVSGGNIKFSSIGTTKMFCPQGSAALLEKKFLRALEQVTSYKKSDAVLTLSAGKKVILKFQPKAKSILADESGPVSPSIIMPARNATTELEDRRWFYTVASGSRPGVSGTASITFNGESKSASGDSGCSGFSGEYTIDGDKFTFSQTMMTNRICADEDRQGLSSVFMTGLGLANRFKIIDGKLNLYRENRLLLTLESADK